MVIRWYVEVSLLAAWRVRVRLVRRSLMVLDVHLSIRLAELVQNGARALGIDSGDLSHYLAVVGMRVISKLLVV